MTTRLRQSWQLLREPFWFVPGLLMLGAQGMLSAIAVFGRLLRALAVGAAANCSPDRKPIFNERDRLLLDHTNQMLLIDYEKQQVLALYNELKTTLSVDVYLL